MNCVVFGNSASRLALQSQPCPIRVPGGDKERLVCAQYRLVGLVAARLGPALAEPPEEPLADQVAAYAAVESFLFV